MLSLKAVEGSRYAEQHLPVVVVAVVVVVEVVGTAAGIAAVGAAVRGIRL